MAFEIAHAEKFPLELGTSPKKVRKSYPRVLNVLRDNPDFSCPPLVKKLSGYKDLWRIKVSEDYRLIYKVDSKAKLVTLLMLGTRGKIYDRLGANDKGEPGFRILARAEELLESEPNYEEVGQAEIHLAMDQSEDNTSPDNQLPEQLSEHNLTEWGIPAQFQKALTKVNTEGELLAQKMPDEVLERLMNCLWPPKIEEVLYKPVRVAFDPKELEDAANGERTLESFLLKLDESQKEFLGRFETERPKGPWLLKGGPGSGKSTVALYSVKSILNNANQPSLLENKPVRILFTTFTKSLINASSYLLNNLNVDFGQHQLDVRTVDSLAFISLPPIWKGLKPAYNPKDYIELAINDCKRKNSRFSFTNKDAEFILSEIDWVIAGQGLKSVNDYLHADRSGRGRRITQSQRKQLWDLYVGLQKILRQNKSCIFSERLKVAAENVSPQYDYVFIDEAQDLKPIAIRFLIGLCHDPSNVFITADTNQSIYGNGISWSKVASDLKFQGRARTLKRNYRTTKEIWEAMLQLAPTENADKETLSIDAPIKGPSPVMAYYSTPQAQADRLNSFLHESLMKERVTAASAAILCPNRRVMESIKNMIDPKFNAKIMQSNEVDLSHPGVKIMTMHTAKGLQFPVVAVVGVESGNLPSNTPSGIDPGEHLEKQRRLLFVACSRAMRRLIMFTNRNRPSKLINGLTDEYWDIEELN